MGYDFQPDLYWRHFIFEHMGLSDLYWIILVDYTFLANSTFGVVIFSYK